MPNERATPSVHPGWWTVLAIITNTVGVIGCASYLWGPMGAFMAIGVCGLIMAVGVKVIEEILHHSTKG